jgi:hypothetical protein
MSEKIPSGYEKGVDYIEGLTVAAMRAWLKSELYGENHVLAGQADDFPVQAIVNHYKYLTMPAQNRMCDALVFNVTNWSKGPDRWPEPAAIALLNIVAELRVYNAKLKLESFVKSALFFQATVAIRPVVIRAIATLSSNNDRTFWNEIPLLYGDFAGMAFQVLTRIAPQDALELIGKLPNNDLAVGGVARKLPDFVSHFDLKEQSIILKQIVRSLERLPEKHADELRNALNDEGFCLVQIQHESEEQISALRQSMEALIMASLNKAVQAKNTDVLRVDQDRFGQSIRLSVKTVNFRSNFKKRMKEYVTTTR